MVTIPDSERRTTYAPATATTGFEVGFPIFNDDDVRVYLNGVLETGWTMEATYVDGVSSDAVVRADGDGWAAVTVTIVGAYRPRRVDQFADGRGVPAKDLNLILNRLIATGRETFDRVARAIVAPWGTILVPLPSLTAGKALVVNTAADGFEMGPTATDISTAQANATAAALSAAQAAALLAGFLSTTSVLIGTGTKVFTVPAGLPLVPGLFVAIVSTANVTNYMQGQITAYAGTTLTVGVTTVGGSGTLASWRIVLSGATGPSGPGTGDMLKTDNLLGLSNYVTARANMGLGAMALVADVLFANLNAAAVASQADAEAGTATNKLMTPQRVAQALAALNPFSARLLHVRDEKASGTAPGTLTGGTWDTRTLNTVKTNEISGASLASNKITLPAGTYWISAKAPASYFSDAGGALHKAKLYNVTDASDVIFGSSMGTRDDTSFSIVEGRFTLSATKDLEIRHRASGLINAGIPCSFSVIEVYTDVQIWKVA